MRRRDELTDAQRSLIEPLFPRPPRRRSRGRPATEPRPIMNVVLCGFFAPERAGRIYPSGTRRARHATDGSSTGCVRG